MVSAPALLCPHNQPWPASICPVLMPPAGPSIPRTQLEVSEAGLSIGAGVTLSRLMAALKEQIAAQPATRTRGLKALAQQLHWFAGLQIRNVATLGGNIVTASPISDLNPLWMAAGAAFVVASAGGVQRSLPASEFFLAYRWVVWSWRR